MKWDKAVNIILLFVFLAFLSELFFGTSILYGEEKKFSPGWSQLFFSLGYAILWIVLLFYTAAKKRRHFLVGVSIYCCFIYLPGWILPALTFTAGEEQSLLKMLLELVLKKMYSLVHEPMSGFVGIMSLETIKNLMRRILPVFFIVYAAVQVFRYYRNAYISFRLQMNASVKQENPALAKELAAFSEPAPSGGIRAIKRVSDVRIPLHGKRKITGKLVMKKRDDSN